MVGRYVRVPFVYRSQGVRKREGFCTWRLLNYSTSGTSIISVHSSYEALVHMRKARDKGP